MDSILTSYFTKQISYIFCARGVYYTIFYFVKSNDLANLGLWIAVFDAEKKAAATWNDYDEETCHTSLVTNGLNAVAGVAYFTAFFFKHANPPVSAVGAAIMVGTVGGSAALEGIIFKHQYDLQKHVMLTSGPPFWALEMSRIGNALLASNNWIVGRSQFSYSWRLKFP